jgi:hypothetical protein
MRLPPKQSPEGEGGSKQLAIMEAVDDTEGVRDRDPQTLAERIQICFLCPRPACAALDLVSLS